MRNQVQDATNIKDMEELEQVKVGKQAKLKSMTAVKEEAKLRKKTLMLANWNKKQLGAFIRLVDYMTVETIVGLNLDSIQQFAKALVNNDKKRLFTCQVDFGETTMHFKPTEADFREVFKGILDCMVKESAWSRILHQQI